MCGATVCSAAAAGSRSKSGSDSFTLHPPPGYSPPPGVSPALPGPLLALTGPVDSSFPMMASHSPLLFSVRHTFENVTRISPTLPPGSS